MSTNVTSSLKTYGKHRYKSFRPFTTAVTVNMCDTMLASMIITTISIVITDKFSFSVICPHLPSGASEDYLTPVASTSFGMVETNFSAIETYDDTLSSRQTR